MKSYTVAAAVFTVGVLVAGAEADTLNGQLIISAVAGLIFAVSVVIWNVPKLFHFRPRHRK